ncbi:MAG: TolC family protein [Myxococcota bacterium]
MQCPACLRWAALLTVGLGMPTTAHGQSAPPYPLGRELPAFEAPASPAVTPPKAPPPEPLGVVRLEDALTAALLRNPELSAGGHELRAREAALLQAGAHPNPTLSLEVEDFAGSGDFAGFDRAQTSLVLGQRIELGGKRAARIELASAALGLASWDYEVRRIDMLVRTAGAFVDVLVAQERHRLAAEGLELAQALERAAARRLRAGLGSPADEIRAAVAADVAEVEREHTEHALETARQVLAASWAGEAARFDRAEGDLERLPVVPSLEELAALVEASPGVARWQTELVRRDALRARARSERVPDVTLRVGPRRLSGPDETTLVVGASIPLPLWNRNRGAIAEAEHRLAKAAAETYAARVRTVTALETARVRLEAASEEAAMLKARVLPGTERAVEALRRGYASGRSQQLEVLDAERTRLAAHDQYLGVLRTAHHSAQQIERLTGVPLEVRP